MSHEFSDGAAGMTELGRTDLRSLRVGALLNKSSGSCSDKSEDELSALLRQAGIEPVFMGCVEGAELERNLEKIEENKIDVLVVLGGDGTIRVAAEHCGKKGIILLPLPGGTMNMLPKALYGERDWQTVVSETLADPHIVLVSGGEVAGKLFFCAGIFGAPSLWSGAREAVRSNRFRDAFRRARYAYNRIFADKITYQFSQSDRGPAAAVTVICPLVSAAMSSSANALEAAALDIGTAREAFRLAINALFSDWRQDPNVSCVATQTVRLQSRGNIPAILDGEAVSLQRKAEIRFVPRGFTALVPRNALYFDSRRRLARTRLR